MPSITSLFLVTRLPRRAPQELKRFEMESMTITLSAMPSSVSTDLWVRPSKVKSR